jgi:hypothetical protein
MPRKTRPLDRDLGQVRDASLIVIASEDELIVKDYFSRFGSSRVSVLVLPTEGGRSAPAAVLARLDDFGKEYQIRDDDQLWLCTDKDHWAEPAHIANLVQMLQQCRQKGYQVAISNPCFELWLLLHVEDVDPAAPLKCSEIVKKLKALPGGYNKKDCDGLGVDGSKVAKAVERAACLDTDGSAIPDAMLTRVYGIIRVLQAKGVIGLA